MSEEIWYLYILKCGDGTLYTGITPDVEKRLEVHRSGKGAKYTRGRGPLELCYTEICGSQFRRAFDTLNSASFSISSCWAMTG